MSNDIDSKSDTIIDLDADQVIEDRPENETVVPPAPNRVRRSNWFVPAAAILFGALAGGWLYRDVLSTYFPSDQVTTLTQKLATLETSARETTEQVTNIDKLSRQLKLDLDSMEAKDTELSSLTQAAQQNQTMLEQRLAEVEKILGETKQAVTDLQARPITGEDAGNIDPAALTGLQQRLESLEKDVASLTVKPTEIQDNKVALSQALADLKAKVAAGTSFSAEHERLQRMVPAAAGLGVLERYAALGLPNSKGMGNELRQLINYLPKPAAPAPEDDSWYSGITESLSNLITIKVEGETDWPATAKAAAALADNGDLPNAIDAMSRPEGAKPGGVQQWIDRAQARLALEAAVQSVDEAVLRVMATKG